MPQQLSRKRKRPSWDRYFMRIAKVVATRATCDRGRAGCVIVLDNQILVTGYVGSPKGLSHCDEAGHKMRTITYEDGSQSRHCMRTTHAEQNAIAQAAKRGVVLNGATLFCTIMPCYTCAKMIITVGIKRVVCEKRYHVGKETLEDFELARVEFKCFGKKIASYDDQ